MERANLDCAMARQARYTAEFGKKILAGMTLQKFIDCISMEELLSIKRVYITGCGDSYLAGVAAKKAFETLSGVECVPTKCSELSRHMDAKAFGTDPKPLVIGISISGTVSRVAEALTRAAKHGANTLAITDHPESIVGQAAAHTLALDMPQLEPCAGVCSYVASTLALMCLANRIGIVRGLHTLEYTSTFEKHITDYCDAVAAKMEEIEEDSYQAALALKDKKAFDFVADGLSAATSHFGAAKLVELIGACNSIDDCEDWCHINYFINEPEKIGTFVIIDKDSQSMSRTLEVIGTMVNIGRDPFVVTDADPAIFPAGAHVLSLPEADVDWVKPMLQHVHFNFIAGFLSELTGIPAFRAFEGSVWKTEEGSSHIKDSQIVIY